MSILIVGSDGNQGRRFGAILKFLGKSFFRYDLGRTKLPEDTIKTFVEGIIITTPTDTHLDFIEQYSKYDIPILCEKPLTKYPKLLERVRGNTNLSMVLQYEYLLKESEMSPNGPSFYNYFRHGNDGLVWDCLQIIGLAKSAVTVREDSPIWECMINGQDLSISHMDEAYVMQVKDWLAGKMQDLGRITAMHEKVFEYAASKAD